MRVDRLLRRVWPFDLRLPFARLVTAVIIALLLSQASGAENHIIIFNDNGAWCWFQDERAVIHNSVLTVGSVADAHGTGGAGRSGNIEIVTYDLKARRHKGVSVLHANLQHDDHDTPALLVRPDGRFLAVYAKHGSDRFIRYRISARPDDSTAWQAERQLTRGAGVTYSNLFRLSAENDGNGRIYNFYRGEGWNPNFVVSDDNGESWTYGGRLIMFKGRPYVKYTSNNTDKIHFTTTEHHPNNRDTSIYHGYYKGGKAYESDGTLIGNLRKSAIPPTEATQVFRGDANNVAWPCDIHLDAKGHPYIGFSVQKNKNMKDLRYHYARWDGTKWHTHEIAHAGTALYPREADYSGLLALDPSDLNTIYISADVDPATGQALISNADQKRHYEIFKGVTRNGGANWAWQPVTKNSKTDNIRPIVPKWDENNTLLLWLRGTYHTYTSYDLDVVGIINPVPVGRLPRQ